MTKRRDIGYRTSEFRDPKGTAKYPLAVPFTLWQDFRRRCREFRHADGQTGISVRARLLALVKRDVEEWHDASGVR